MSRISIVKQEACQKVSIKYACTKLLSTCRYIDIDMRMR